MLESRWTVPMTVMVTLTLATCGPAMEFPKIDRKPPAADWGRGKLTSLPRFDPNSTNSFQVDLRCYDVSGADLKDRLTDLLHADFDDRTQWPEAARMPEGFDYKRVREVCTLVTEIPLLRYEMVVTDGAVTILGHFLPCSVLSVSVEYTR